MKFIKLYNIIHDKLYVYICVYKNLKIYIFKRLKPIHKHLNNYLNYLKLKYYTLNNTLYLYTF